MFVSVGCCVAALSDRIAVATFGESGPSCAANSDGSLFYCNGAMYDGNSGTLLWRFGESDTISGMSATIIGEALFVIGAQQVGSEVSFWVVHRLLSAG